MFYCQTTSALLLVALCAADVRIIDCIRKKKLSCQKREVERNGCIKVSEKGRIQ